MIKIRRLNYFDCPKLKRLISYLSDDDKLVSSLFSESARLLNAILPLQLKFYPESYVLTQDNEIKGLISVRTTQGNFSKICITRLVFKDNEYEIGKRLIDFVVQKYGAKGANTFQVTIDESHDELFDLFINGCGFRQCSSETLWKNDKPIPQKSDIKLRYAQNSDAKRIASLYNNEIDPLYKTSLERFAPEFKECIMSGFNDYYKTRFLLEDDGNLLGYFSVTTTDNTNYIIDITTNKAYNLDYEPIINKLIYDIALRKRAFYPIIKQKKFTSESERLENYLKGYNYYSIQTRHILIRDFYRTLKEESSDWKVFLLGESALQ